MLAVASEVGAGDVAIPVLTLLLVTLHTLSATCPASAQATAPRSRF